MTKRAHIAAAALLLLLPLRAATEPSPCAAPPISKQNDWPAEFKPMLGKHKTIANRVLAFEAPALKERDPRAEQLLADLLNEARQVIRYERRSLDPQQHMVGILKLIDLLLTRRRFIFPPNDLVDMLSCALTPRIVPPEDRIDARQKNIRKRFGLWNLDSQEHYYTDCDTTAILYKAIAEQAGFELKLVNLPNHTFLRFYFADGTFLNWDPNDAEVVSNADYRREFGASDADVQSGRYLRPLTNRELAGYLHMLRGKQFENRGLWSQAEGDYRKAIELYPQDPASRNALAWMYLTVEELRPAHVKDAIRLAEQAVQCDPGVAQYHDTLAFAFAFDAQHARAAELEKTASSLADDKETRELFQQRSETFSQGRTPELPERKPFEPCRF